MLIYKATFNNGKSYIGQTKNSLSVRQRNHRYRALKIKSKSAFHCAIRKYGFRDIKWHELEQCNSWNKLQKREKFLIKYHNTICPNGYNETCGGRQPKETEEIKQKRIKNNPKYWLGKKFSDKHKSNISKGNKGISRNLGRTLTVEHRLKIKKGNIGKNRNYLYNNKFNSKKINRIDMNGNIKEFNLIKIASVESNVSRSSISNVLAGRAKTAGGYCWKLK